MLDSPGSGRCSRSSPPPPRPSRNATQRELTATLGTAGATHVRFLFGFPFALVFLLVVLLASGATLPTPAGGLLAVDPAGRRSRRSPPPR